MCRTWERWRVDGGVGCKTALKGRGRCCCRSRPCPLAFEAVALFRFHNRSELPPFDRLGFVAMPTVRFARSQPGEWCGPLDMERFAQPSLLTLFLYRKLMIELFLQMVPETHHGWVVDGKDNRDPYCMFFYLLRLIRRNSRNKQYINSTSC